VTAWSLHHWVVVVGVVVILAWLIWYERNGR
jgi:hypothetical protein